MSTFKEIAGRNIRSYTTDPANPQEGQIWYNSTSQVLKGEVLLAAWSAGGNVGSSFYMAATGGTQNAAYKAGGGFPRASTASESYDGSTWTVSGSLNTARSRLSSGVVGTQTAGLGTGGYTTTPGYISATEEYDGSGWTSVTSMPTGRQFCGGSGLQTAALVFGGLSPASPPTSSISYNGSSWTATPSMSTGGNLTGVGTQTATLAVGTITENYDGSSWTAGTTMNSPRPGISLGGTQTLAIGSGGFVPPSSATSATEKWNGTSWTTDASLSTARRSAGSHGSSVDNSMVSSGNSSAGPQLNSTEEYTFAPTTQTFTTS